MNKESECDFDGEDIVFPIYPSNKRFTQLKLHRFSSETHPQCINDFMEGELFWDTFAKTLYHKNRDGQLFKANFEKV